MRIFGLDSRSLAGRDAEVSCLDLGADLRRLRTRHAVVGQGPEAGEPGHDHALARAWAAGNQQDALVAPFVPL